MVSVRQNVSCLLLAGVSLLVAGCADDGAAGLRVEAGGAELVVDLSPLGLRFSRVGVDGPLLQSAPSAEAAAFAPVALSRGKPSVKMRLGAFGFRDEPEPWQALVTASLRDGATLELPMADGTPATLEVEAVADGVVRLRVTAPTGLDRAAMTFVCNADDQFLGLGGQTPLGHRGQIVPLWTQEQGVGKSDKVDHYGAYTPLGHTYDAYLPIPVLFNPRGYMMLVETDHRVIFDFCKTQADRWRVEAWSGELSIVLVTASDTATMLERMTALTGRTKLPAPWVFGPWLDAVKGSAEVRRVANLARTRSIPASAIWTEDWAGGQESAGGYHLSYQWDVDRTLYPDIEALADEVHGLGFRFLAYFNSFVIKGTPNWQETEAQGLLIKDEEGKTLTFLGPPRLETTSLLDLSNEKTRDWAKAKMQAAVDLGFDGWMADFAEWLPWETKLDDGRRGDAAHNDYPRQWQRLNQDFFAQARPDGDFAYFVRSGWTGTQALAPVVWAGDQNTTFEQDDGLPTVVRLGLNLGLSGVTIYAHDIAGYTSIFNDPASKELYYRWTELGAFSPVMRTHHGSSGGLGWTFDKDDETIDFFGRYAREHVRLYPYLRGLAKQAELRGLPLWRPMAMYYPAQSWTITDQFLLGEALLIAPVLVAAQTERDVVLPIGRWYDYWSTKIYDGGTTTRVAAPLDTIPVFVRAGAVLPLLPAGVETFVSGGKGVVDLNTVRDRLVVRCYHGADGMFTLEDGTILGLQAGGIVPTDALVIRQGGDDLPVCATADAVDCFRHDAAARTFTVELERGALELQAFVGARPSFTFQAPFSRKTRLTLELRY